MKRILFFAIIMLVCTASCGKKEIKKVSQESKTATEAFSVIEEIRVAYMKKDTSAIERNTTKNGFKAITNVMKIFDSVDITFNPVLVEIDDNAVHVNVSWKGTWYRGGKTTHERGMAIFVLNGSPLRVDNVLRATPFKYPEH